MWNWNSFDIDLPTECDDEYWAHADPELAFKQPPARPSKVAFFNCYVRLHQILAFAMRTIVRLPLRLLFALFVYVRLGWRLSADDGIDLVVGSTRSTSRRRSSGSSASSGSSTSSLSSTRRSTSG